MAVNILMPADAALVKWHRAPGDKVDRGDLLMDIETEKTVVEVQAEADGVLGGDRVAEGTRNLKEGDTVGQILPAAQLQASAVSQVAAVMQAIRNEAVGTPAPAPAPAPATAPMFAMAPAVAPARAEATPATHIDSAARGRVFASPLARRLAAEARIDVAALQGSGPNGRVVERDVRAASSRHALAPAPASLPAEARALAPATPGRAVEAIALDPMRRTIAQRLTQSKQSVPHFYLTAQVELDALLALRDTLNRHAPQGATGAPAWRISINDFIVKALALALQRVPAANTVWDGERLLRHHASDVGVAVAVEGGLFTPVVRDADRKSLQEISAQVRDFAARAARRQLLPAEYQGGTSSVSNLGMYGVESFSAILNPPQSTILAVGESAARVAVRDGQPVIVQAMTVTLSCDHRVVDGAVGAQLLGAFKSLIERPNALRARSTRLDPAS